MKAQRLPGLHCQGSGCSSCLDGFYVDKDRCSKLLKSFE